jgi:hypothetical protein
MGGLHFAHSYFAVNVNHTGVVRLLTTSGVSGDIRPVYAGGPVWMGISRVTLEGGFAGSLVHWFTSRPFRLVIGNGWMMRSKRDGRWRGCS